MKCMAVPANLTWDEWYKLINRQCKELQLKDTYYSDEKAWRKLFDAGMTVNDAVSYRIQEADDD